MGQIYGLVYNIYMNKKANQTSFKKGNTSWNKDTKGVMKPNKTSFKKGSSGFTGKHTKETIEKIRAKKIGKSSWNKGLHIRTGGGAKKGSIPHNKGKKQLQTTGSKNHNWKNGITPENHKIRTSLEMKLFRKACMERDNFTCAKTGQRGGELVVHHINNFADFSELRTSIENGITLSKKSHKEFHHIYGNKNNSREQLTEFLNK